MSFGTHQSLLAIATNEEIWKFNVKTGEATKIGAFKDADAIEMTSDGMVYVMKRGELIRINDNKPASEPRASLGDRPQFIDGYWYGHAWHGTIKRGDERMDPNPGVIIGGASGSFIGHLDQNTEVFYGRGIAKLWDGVFALSGLHGILQVASWDGAKKQLTIVRRIGAVPFCQGLGLDRDGNIFHHTGVWSWQDGPDAPRRYQINPPEGLGQVVMLDDRRMVAAANLWGKPAFLRGTFNTEVKIDRNENSKAQIKDSVGAVAIPRPGGYFLLVMMENGQTFRFTLNSEGTYQADDGEVTLQTASPIKTWTSLAWFGETLIAAGDGYVIQLKADGTHWKESKRWNAFGKKADEQFGKRIHLGTDGKTLVVADSERHQIFGFVKLDEAPEWQFGTVDKAGSTLQTMDHPETITIQGNRVVVYDAGNQRLLKLRLSF
jgi:hypothetical protein